MTKKKRLIDHINSMGDDKLISLHNAYCRAIGDEDSCIYSTHDLDEVLEGRTPTDILCMEFYGNFNPRDRFFWLNGYGNLESTGYAVDAPIFASDIADYILSEEDSLGNDEIQEILDEDDEDEREEK